MIHFVAQRWYEITIRNFLDAWGMPVRDRVAFCFYDELAHATHLPVGTYVFTDHDRLSETQLQLAGAVADQLLANGASHGVRVLSHPRTAKGRVEFLRTMHEHRINDFRAIRVVEGVPGDLRFPVFLRLANQHKGSLTDLLRTREELERALESEAVAEHRTSRQLLVVEFSDTSSGDGRFYKYGAVRIGDRILPRHVFAARQWMCKLNAGIDESWLAVEQEYFRRFERDVRPRLARVFEIAGVEYGRLDFSMKGDELRAWEINTNPMLVHTPDVIHEQRLVQQATSAKWIVEALVALDEAGVAAAAKAMESGANGNANGHAHANGNGSGSGCPSAARGANGNANGHANGNGQTRASGNGHRHTTDPARRYTVTDAHGLPRIPIDVDPELRRRAGATRGDHYLRHVGRGLNRLLRLPPARNIIDACARAQWLADR